MVSRREMSRLESNWKLAVKRYHRHLDACKVCSDYNHGKVDEECKRGKVLSKACADAYFSYMETLHG